MVCGLLQVPPPQLSLPKGQKVKCIGRVDQRRRILLKMRGYAKNDHLGFQIHYLWQGSRRRCIPDFIVRLNNGKTLALEIKGVDSEHNRAKRTALDEWVKAVNASGGFGTWTWDVAFDPAHTHDIIAKAIG
jgi:hypothetical protein